MHNNLDNLIYKKKNWKKKGLINMIRRIYFEVYLSDTTGKTLVFKQAYICYITYVKSESRSINLPVFLHADM